MRVQDERGKATSEHLNDETRADAVDSERRTIMGLAAGGLVGAMFGLTPTTAEATGGIGFVGSAQAQTGPATAAPWWPSKYGKDDEIGATNLITSEKILDALKQVKTGKVYEMSHPYRASPASALTRPSG
jgi:hypothetical protein